MNDYKERKERDYQIGLIRENEIEIYLKTYIWTVVEMFHIFSLFII